MEPALTLLLWLPAPFLLGVGSRSRRVWGTAWSRAVWIALVVAMLVFDGFATRGVYDPPPGSHPDGLEMIAFPVIGSLELVVGAVAFLALFGIRSSGARPTS